MSDVVCDTRRSLLFKLIDSRRRQDEELIGGTGCSAYPRPTECKMDDRSFDELAAAIFTGLLFRRARTMLAAIYGSCVSRTVRRDR